VPAQRPVSSSTRVRRRQRLTRDAVVMTAQQQLGLVGPAGAGGMTTRTTAVVTQQQALSANPDA